MHVKMGAVRLMVADDGRRGTGGMLSDMLEHSEFEWCQVTRL